MIPPVVAKLVGDIRDLEVKLGAAEKKIQQVARAGGDTTARELAKGKAAALGLGGTLLAVGAMGVKAYADLAGQVRSYVRVAGGSTQQASEQVAVFKSLGVDTDTAAASMFKMSRNVVKNADTLSALGVEIAHNKDGTVDLTGTLENASAAYKATNDQLAKNAIAYQLAGRGGAALLPILAVGRDRIRQIKEEAAKRGEIITDADAKKAIAFSRAMHDLGDSAKGLEVQLGRALVPAITATAHGLEATIDFLDRNKAAAAALATVIAGPLIGAAATYLKVQSLSALRGIVGAFQSIGAAVRGTTAAEAALAAESGVVGASALLGFGLVATGAAVAAAGVAVLQSRFAASAKAAKSMVTAVEEGAGSSPQAQIDALRAKADELKKTVSSTPHFNLLGHDIFPLSEGAAKANDKLKAVNAEVARLTEQLDAAKHAQNDFGEVLDEGGAKAADMAKDMKTLRGQLLSVVDAQKAVEDSGRTLADDRQTIADKTRDLNDLLRKGRVDIDAVQAATRDAAAADKAAADAKLGVISAQKKLDDILHPSARTVEEAQIAQRDADRSHVAALAKVADLEKQIRIVAADPAELARVSLELAAARDEVERSTFAQADATTALNDVLDPTQSKAVADATANVTAAQRTVADATDAARLAHDKLVKAQAGDPDFDAKVAASRRDVAAAQRQLTTDTDSYARSLLSARDATDQLKTLMSEAGAPTAAVRDDLAAIAGQVPALMPLILTLDRLLGYAASTPVSAGHETAAQRGGGGRAKGGAVSAGTLYSVNEAGREWFRPNVGGQIIPLGQTQAGSGTVVNVTVTVQGALMAGTPAEVAGALAPHITDALIAHGRRIGGLRLP